MVLGKTQSRQDGKHRLSRHDQSAEGQGPPKHQQVFRGGKKHLVHRFQGKACRLGKQRSIDHLEKGPQQDDQQQDRRPGGEDLPKARTPSCHERAPSFRHTHRAHRPTAPAITKNSRTLATLSRW